MHTVGLPRTCLGFTNFLFFLLGGVGFVVCVWCAINTDFFREVNYTVTKSSFVLVLANFVNLRLWLTPLTSFLIPLAIIAMLTSCCGIVGAGCQIKCAIKTYIFLVTALTCVSFWLFFVSFIYNIYTLNPSTRNYMQSSLQNSYGKENDLVTYIWDYIMVNYECCGVVNYRDFTNSNWQKVNTDRLYPIQCCKLSNRTALIPVSKNCTKSLDSSLESYKDFGCFYILRKVIVNNRVQIIIYFILLALVYMTLILFAYCIARGEPLLGAMAGKYNTLMRQKVQKEEPKPIPSESSLQNMMFVEEPPKKVVKVVSAINPFQSYKFSPNAYSGGDTTHPYSMRSHV